MKNESTSVISLKEQRRHGDELMPINAYEYSAPYGISPMYLHWHNEMELFMLCEGKLKFRCGENIYDCESGSMFFINSGRLHSAEKAGSEDVKFRSIVFHPDILCGNDLIRAKYVKPVLDGKMLLPVVINSEMNIRDSFDELFRTLYEKGFGYELAVKEKLFGIFLRLIENSQTLSEKENTDIAASYSSAVKTAIDYINNNYSNPISIDELAEKVNMSVGHFCRCFKIVTLKTPVQYINNIRTARAAEMLISTDKQILDISLDTGFNSASYFISVFKENMGMTPSRFRKEYSKK